MKIGLIVFVWVFMITAVIEVYLGYKVDAVFDLQLAAINLLVLIASGNAEPNKAS